MELEIKDFFLKKWRTRVHTGGIGEWKIYICVSGEWKIYICVSVCVRIEGIYIYVYYFVDNNGVLLGIKFTFKKNKNKNERIEVLNKKEVKFFFIL